MTGETLSESATFADRLSPLERAKAGLQEELTVFEIGLLTYPDNDGRETLEKRARLTDFLLQAIKAGQLYADGNPDGCKPIVWFSPEGKASIDGPLSYALQHQGTRRTLRRQEQLVASRFGSVWKEEQDWHGDNCLVTWLDYLGFFKLPAAHGIPKPNWPGRPPESALISYDDAKARLGASDADMCGWTLDRGFRPNDRLVAYQKINGRLSEFDWSDAKPDFPWLDQLGVLRFSRTEVEHFQPDPDPDLRYLTYREAIERVRETHPRLSRESIENRLMLVAMAEEGTLNLDLVARDPLARKRKLTRQTFPECLFLVIHIDKFARELGEDQGTAQLSEPDELLDRPRTRNTHPMGLSDNYQRWRRLDAHPRPDHLELQAQDGSLRVAVKAHCWRAYLVPGNPDPSQSAVDESGWSRDGGPPKGSPLLLLTGFWFLEKKEAYHVLSGDECRVNWLLPPDPDELHRRWPDLFPEGEFHLDLEKWRQVRREDLFWLDTPSQSESKPEGPASLPLSASDKSEQGAAGIQNPAMNRQCITDKASFLKMATWKGTQQATVNQHSKAAYFKGQYDMPTLLRWASEVDPRPKDKRGGRPRKS